MHLPKDVRNFQGTENTIDMFMGNTYPDQRVCDCLWWVSTQLYQWFGCVTGHIVVCFQDDRSYHSEGDLSMSFSVQVSGAEGP